MDKDIILVTGGAGYIGSVLVHELVSQGKKVRVFDKLYFGDSALSDLRDQIDLIKGDVRNFPKEALDGVSAVIHLGSLSNDPTAEFDPKANHEINYEGTMRVAEACVKKGVSRMTFASSAAVIGFHVDGIASEDFVPNPQSEYAQSKVDAENGLKSLVSDRFHPVIFRQATVNGLSRRMRWDLVINTMTKDAFSKNKISVLCAGDNWRPLIHVKDISFAHIQALSAPAEKVSGQIFNLVEKNYQILDLGKEVKETLEKFAQVELDVQKGAKESRSYRISPDKAKKVLGFEARISVAETAVEIYDALKAGEYTDFENPIYYNIAWMKKLVEAGKKI